MSADPDAWLDKYIEQQQAYWVSMGFPADIISQVAEGIERYGDDFFDNGREDDRTDEPSDPTTGVRWMTPTENRALECILRNQQAIMDALIHLLSVAPAQGAGKHLMELSAAIGYTKGTADNLKDERK